MEYESNLTVKNGPRLLDVMTNVDLVSMVRTLVNVVYSKVYKNVQVNIEPVVQNNLLNEDSKCCNYRMPFNVI